nr:type II toxin-antitoxin system HigB family toxin [Chamaesiphon sp. OTE_75_metabat_556]
MFGNRIKFRYRYILPHFPHISGRAAYPSADLVGIYTVFNIKGNHYRLIAQINYRSGTIFVRNILTHAEYDKEQWKS